MISRIHDIQACIDNASGMANSHVMHRTMTPILILLCATLLSGHACADETLWRRIQQEENIILLMRHSYVEPGDGHVYDPSGNCQGERLISPAGRQHAARVGEAFATRQLQPRVLSSPLCRARDTARIAFGRAELMTQLRPVQNPTDTVPLQQATRSALRQLRGKQPVVVVSHQPTIDALTLELINIGDVVVGKIGTDGDIEVIGQLSIQ